MKATHWTITKKFLDYKTPKRSDFKKPKWVEFCEYFINYPGVVLKLYEARQTHSKYITIAYQGQEFKVRFSDHKPRKSSERKKDCDFFVGVNNQSVTTTEMAIIEVEKWLKNLT